MGSDACTLRAVTIYIVSDACAAVPTKPSGLMQGEGEGGAGKDVEDGFAADRRLISTPSDCRAGHLLSRWYRACSAS